MEILQRQPTQTSTKKSEDSGKSSLFICSRCEGHLVRTYCISPAEGIAEFQIAVLKCLQCGDLVDETILENRYRSHINQSHHI